MKSFTFLIFFGFLFFTACKDNDPTILSDGDNFEYKIEVIEGCEYIYKTGYNTGYMAHKGNCKNPIHEHNH